MPVRAVIFDLSGTLVRFSPAAYQAVVTEMARVLSAPSYDFAQLWARIMDEAEARSAGTMEDDLDYALRALGVFTHLDQRQAALDLLFEFERHVLIPEKDAADLLEALRTAGLRTGLISNTVAVVARLWPESTLAPLIDAAVFSCEAGLRKPDRGIYEIAAERLRVTPGDCLYVGDGGAGELPGAILAGMTAVMLRRSDEGAGDDGLLSREPWAGPTITSLDLVLPWALQDRGTSPGPRTSRAKEAW